MNIVPQTQPDILLLANTADISGAFRELLTNPAIKIYHPDIIEDGLNFFDHHPEIKLVILAVDFNGVSGFGLLKDFKGRRSDVPVFLISQQISLESVNLAAMSGCDEFLQAPVSNHELTALIHKYLKTDNAIPV